jgi:hypothetical protein
MKAKHQTVVEIKSFAFTNPSGGTGMSNWNFNARFSKESANVRLVKAWMDYETGLRFIGVSDDQELTDYLNAVALADDDKQVFFSEHDLSRPKEAGELMERFCNEVGQVRTSDGYTFRKDESGKWTDGDMTFNNLSQMMEEADLFVDIDFLRGEVQMSSQRNTPGS